MQSTMNSNNLNKALIALLHSLDCRRESMMIILSLLTTERERMSLIHWINNHQQASEEQVIKAAEKIKEKSSS